MADRDLDRARWMDLRDARQNPRFSGPRRTVERDQARAFVEASPHALDLSRATDQGRADHFRFRLWGGADCVWAASWRTARPSEAPVQRRARRTIGPRA